MSFQAYQKSYKAAVVAAQKYIAHSDVNDIFFGKKYVDGEPTPQQVIRFNVHRKQPKSALKSSRLLPKKIGQFLTDVTSFNPQKNTRRENPFLMVRPIIGGLQIQSSLFEDPDQWGTLGAILEINSVRYGITNFHVAFGEHADPDLPPGNVVMVQPKQRSFGRPVGNVDGVFNKFLDYSLFRLNVPSDRLQSVNGFDGEIIGFTNPEEDLHLFKFGASTGRTFGIFDGRSIIDKHRVTIHFDPQGPGDSNRISAGGDSGSIWLTRQNAAEGKLRMFALHFGGDVQHNVAFASLFSSISASIRTKIPLP